MVRAGPKTSAIGREMLVRHIFKEVRRLGWRRLVYMLSEGKGVTVSVWLTLCQSLKCVFFFFLTPVRLKRKIKFRDKGDVHKSDCAEIRPIEHQGLMFYGHLQILIICSWGPTSAGSWKKQESSRKNIYLCYIDYAKAFDCVDHSKLWKILKEMGIPDHLTCLLRKLCRSRSNS